MFLEQTVETVSFVPYFHFKKILAEFDIDTTVIDGLSLTKLLDYTFSDKNYQRSSQLCLNLKQQNQEK